MPEDNQAAPVQEPIKSAESIDPVQKTGYNKTGGMSKNMKIFVIAGVFVILIMCLLIGLLLYLYLDKEDSSSSKSDAGQENEQNEEDNEDLDEEEQDESALEGFVEFEGDYLTAELPENWTIVEYENGAGGYGLLADGNYTGLTAVVIRNESDDDMFSIQAANGIGGVDACETVYRFDDTDATYVSDLLNSSVIYYPGVAAQDIIDDYEDFDFAGKAGRYVDGDKIYWDATDSASFDPHCNEMIDFPDSAGISFTYTYAGSGTQTMESYLIVDEEIDAENFEKLVAVLSSIEFL